MKKIYLPGVIYEMTPKCNLRCIYCYNHWKKDNYLPDFTSYKAKETLKQFMKTVKCDTVTFSGGEPTTDFDELLDCIMYVKRKNKSVTLITNATLLTREKIDLLAALKIDTVEITINSYNSNIHEQMNTIKGSFEKSSNAIKYLIEKNIRVVVPIVLTKNNINDLEKTLNYITSLGVQYIMVNRYNIGGNGCKSYEDILPNLDDLKKAFSTCNEYVSKTNIKIYSLVCTPHCVINPKDYTNIFFSNCNYENLIRTYTLSRDGNIRYCNHSPINLGNIYESTMSDIIDSNNLKKWSLFKPKFCKDCSSENDCQYGCRAASQQIGYTLKKEDPIVSIYKVKKL